MDELVMLKNGKFATVIKEWYWEEHPHLKIMDGDSNERIFDTFLDIDLGGELKGSYMEGRPFPTIPVNSNFHKLTSTVVKSDVEFIDIKS